MMTDTKAWIKSLRAETGKTQRAFAEYYEIPIIDEGGPARLQASKRCRSLSGTMVDSMKLLFSVVKTP